VVELLALLLPVAAASGWWVAKRSVRSEAARLRQGDMDPAYFRGLNYLVNEQPDKAIDVFVRMLEVNSETVELHLALGNLFRRRGETDRAIRIHQNLIARPTLSRPQRAQALLELGQDYLRAGLLDRAEGLFNELVEMDQLVKPALRNLTVIFQHEKDWEKCLEATRKLEKLGDRQRRHDEAHYYCELAKDAEAGGDPGAAQRLLRQAEQADPGNLRTLLMRGELAFGRQDFREALDFFREVETRHPAYAGEVIEQLARCYEVLGLGGEWQNHLREQYARHPSWVLVVAIAEDLRRTRDEAAAIGFVSDHLARKPSLRGLAYLIELHMAGQGEDDGADSTALLNQLAQQLVRDMPAYQCHRCGFSARTLHWQCPGCRSWGTMDPFCERKE
jgi:lipopolysaccharide biosynthesis regulator YciM